MSSDWFRRWKETFGEEPLVFDGGLGTELVRGGALRAGDVPERLVLDCPSAIEEVHRSYVEAGAGVVTTATFGANPLKLAMSGLEARMEEINEKAARLAVEAAGRGAREHGRRVLVAGSVGPCGSLVECGAGGIEWRRAYESFLRQAQVLAPLVDLFVLETFSCILELRLACRAVMEAASGESPLVAMVAPTSPDGVLLTGGTVEEALYGVLDLGVWAFGVNCGMVPSESWLEMVERLASVSPLPLVLEPNGVSYEDGRRVESAPAEFSSVMEEALAACGGSVGGVGGCCGTEPAHIVSLRRMVGNTSPRVGGDGISRSPSFFLCSRGGVVALAGAPSFMPGAGPFMVVGERLNPTGRRKLAASILEGDTALVKREAVSQVEAGAAVLDVNAGIPGGDEASLLASMVRAVQLVADVPLSLDSVDAGVMEGVLPLVHGKPLVNSVTPENIRDEGYLDFLASWGAAVLLLPLGDGVEESAARRLELLEGMIRRCARAGIPRRNMVVDALCFSAGASPRAAAATLETVEKAGRLLGLPVMLGLSNVSFGMPARKVLNAAFLAAAVSRGLSGAILNPLDSGLMRTLNASLLLFEESGCWRESLSERLASSKGGLEGGKREGGAPAASARDVEASAEALSEAVRRADRGAALRLAAELVSNGRSAVDVMQSSIVPAIREVGERFGRGELYLHTLVACAEVVEACWEHLRPFMEEDSACGDAPVVVIATVAGDIHDIGKNIVALMLRNEGFRVVDLGKDVPTELIVEKAREEGADIVALSALMTTTASVMASAVETLHRRLPGVKVMVGGAVVTRRFAERIGADGYGADAAEAVKEARRLAGGG